MEGEQEESRIRLDPGQVELSLARYNSLKSGQLSLHDVYMVHGSPPNRSAKRRAGLVLRYMPATSVFDRSISDPEIVVDFSTMPIRLVRGRDRSGKNDFQIGAASFAS